MNYYEGKRVEVTVKQVWKNGVLVEEIPYTQGQKHGIRKYYFESGDLYSEIPYFQGKLHGVKKYYYKSGKLQDHFSYFIQGKEVTQETYEASIATKPCEGKTITIDGEEFELVRVKK